MDVITGLLAEYAVLLIGVVLVLFTVGPYIWMNRRSSFKTQREISKALRFGMGEPVSIHPKVDRSRCIGSGACIKACPEGCVLGTVDQKAETVYGSRCVGHGACVKACPVGAIELVFGTAKRGVDIPQVFPNFETNVEHVFIAGELGGMGLIRNATVQGQRAVTYMLRDYKNEFAKKKDGLYDLVIVGSGPSGLAASLKAMEKKLNFLTIEQEDETGGAILSYPRAKVVMTSPVVIPLYGKVNAREISKEELLQLWRDIKKKTGLKVSTGEKVMEARKENGILHVKTSKREIKTRLLLLCIGRRGTPRKLGIPGEQQPRVMYRLIEPENYRDHKVLVVGGGDSAVEAAMALATEGADVTLSYRKGVFSRIKPDNHENLSKFLYNGSVNALMDSNVLEVKSDTVLLDQKGKKLEIENNSVFVFAGGEMPHEFLKKIGITIETKYGTR